MVTSSPWHYLLNIKDIYICQELNMLNKLEKPSTSGITSQIPFSLSLTKQKPCSMNYKLWDPAQWGADFCLKMSQHFSKALCGHVFFQCFLIYSSSFSSQTPHPTPVYWFSAYSEHRPQGISFSAHFISRKRELWSSNMRLLQYCNSR